MSLERLRENERRERATPRRRRHRWGAAPSDGVRWLDLCTRCGIYRQGVAQPVSGGGAESVNAYSDDNGWTWAVSLNVPPCLGRPVESPCARRDP